MKEIPITVNHAELQKEIYYHWAAVHQCRSSYARENMNHFINTAVIEHVFGGGRFENRIANYSEIVFNEMVEEYETHLLPAMMRTCRIYLFRLPFIQVNTDFINFNRSMSPVTIPATDSELQMPFSHGPFRFSAYGMPFKVENQIQFLRDHSLIKREKLPESSVHPESRVYIFMVRHDKYRCKVNQRFNVVVLSFVSMNFTSQC